MESFLPMFSTQMFKPFLSISSSIDLTCLVWMSFERCFPTLQLECKRCLICLVKDDDVTSGTRTTILTGGLRRFSCQ